MKRRIAKAVLGLAMLAALAAAFSGVRACALAAKVQLVPAVLAADVAALFALIILIALWGRLYCEIVCPLGVAQDILRWVARKKVRRVCTRLPETKWQLIVKWTVFAIALAAGLA